MPFLIAIDGPAGAGKSTVARRVAGALGYTYLDTGAMYRSVAWKAIQLGVPADDTAALEDIARCLTIDFAPARDGSVQLVYVDKSDVTAAIRTPEVSSLTSVISAVAPVRAVVVQHQRRIAGAAEEGAVLEGRDIGTVVFPQAQLKVFLTASAEERARRRVDEMRQRGIQADATATQRELTERDERDSHRAASPLAMAPDAVAVSTDRLSVDQVVEQVLELWRERRA